MMLLTPKKIRYSKQHSRNDNNKQVQNKFDHGYYGLYAKECGKISAKQIESLRLVLRRQLKKHAKIWFRLIVSRSITKKPNETRLGKGKGNVKYWNSIIHQGKLIVELKGCDRILANDSLNRTKHKLGIKTKSRSRYNRWIL